MATSTRNPETPIFVPSEYHAVEDFSDQWSVEVVETASRGGDSKVRPEGAKDHECEGEPQADSAVAVERISDSAVAVGPIQQ
nr:protein EARLY RESPONSIVE TO DEHYDRATION 15-like [Ipomoea batatas]